jgi:hypothetical protein
MRWSAILPTGRPPREPFLRGLRGLRVNLARNEASRGSAHRDDPAFPAASPFHILVPSFKYANRGIGTRTARDAEASRRRHALTHSLPVSPHPAACTNTGHRATKSVDALLK